ncbi:hypothetical protein Alsa3_CDS0163 [Staphylococcus phage Alsa_3]|nr:hypothetical protein Alsa3_CDS0163 [Staphylococcus phage Alsa_3]WNM51288.1 hypothetical protein Alsa4_CDS0158 [Staphylococcus phage Alsa_4]
MCIPCLPILYYLLYLYYSMVIVLSQGNCKSFFNKFYE